jgi:hypothetical protein
LILFFNSHNVILVSAIFTIVNYGFTLHLVRFFEIELKRRAVHRVFKKKEMMLGYALRIVSRLKSGVCTSPKKIQHMERIVKRLKRESKLL